jgi:putative FmdB family regulatory protein
MRSPLPLWLPSFESGAAGVYNFLVHSSPGGNMPHYEFFCHDCKRLFSKILSLVDYEKGHVVCPKCGSKKVEQRWSAFTVITSKKSA